MICELVLANQLMNEKMKTDLDRAEWWAVARLTLKHDEGVRSFPYVDTTGNLTIGVGRNLRAVPLSMSSIRQMLDEDIERAITSACRIFGPTVFDSWSDPRQHAIVNMIFNLGEKGFAGFINTIEAIKKNDWERAARHASQSKWAKQVGKRAERVLTMMRDEKYLYPDL